MEKDRSYLPEDAVVFDNPAFDNSIIGITTDGAVVYDYDLMVTELSEEDDIPELDAADFISYNTIRAIPYTASMGVPPVIMFRTYDN